MRSSSAFCLRHRGTQTLLYHIPTTPNLHNSHCIARRIIEIYTGFVNESNNESRISLSLLTDRTRRHAEPRCVVRWSERHRAKRLISNVFLYVILLQPFEFEFFARFSYCARGYSIRCRAHSRSLSSTRGWTYFFVYKCASGHTKHTQQIGDDAHIARGVGMDAVCCLLHNRNHGIYIPPARFVFCVV